jgi:hypothetical protein
MMRLSSRNPYQQTSGFRCMELRTSGNDFPKSRGLARHPGISVHGISYHGISGHGISYHGKMVSNVPWSSPKMGGWFPQLHSAIRRLLASCSQIHADWQPASIRRIAEDATVLASAPE